LQISSCSPGYSVCLAASWLVKYCINHHWNFASASCFEQKFLLFGEETAVKVSPKNHPATASGALFKPMDQASVG